MSLTKKHKTELHEVSERIMFAMQEQILDTINWQIEDSLAETMTEEQYQDALTWVYDEVLAGLTEK
tara:strand:+ start:426 stop:623 length:198 start_codon:yes stop_codon:yes gene_type:complete